MAEQEGKAESSSHTHTKGATTTNSTYPENNLRQQNIPPKPGEEEKSTQGRVKQQSHNKWGPQPLPHSSPQAGGRAMEPGGDRCSGTPHTWP